jgi:hypothetical protein
MNWGMKKPPILCGVRKKAQKSVKPSFSHTGIKNKEKKNPSERRCTVKKGRGILKRAGGKS